MNHAATLSRSRTSCAGDTVPPEDQPHLEYLRQWIVTCTGLDFPEKKRASLYRRLSALCWKLGIPNLEEVVRQFREETSPQLAGDIVWTVSTSHTFFFPRTGGVTAFDADDSSAIARRGNLAHLERGSRQRR